MKTKDITGLIGNLQEPCEVPMYSYSRPAYYFWQGVYNELIKTKKHEEALEFLQSKGARWLLDSHSDEIIKLGEELAKRYLNKKT